VTYMAHIRDRVAGWVHVSARNEPVEAARHQAFMLVRLLVTLLAVILIPPYMALRGGLAGWEALVAFCALIPLLSIFVLSRTGNFALAQMIAIMSYVVACFAFAAGTGGLSAPALVWLVLAPVETLFSFSTRLIVLMTGLAMATLFAIVAALHLDWIAPATQLSPAVSLFIIVPAFIYAAMLSLAAMHMNALRGRLERIGAARYQTLAGVMGDLVLRHDKTGAVLFASRDCETLFGLQSRDLMGRGLFERLLVQDRPLFLKTIADASEGNATASCDLRLRTGSTPSGHGDFEEPIFTWVELRARLIVVEGEDFGTEDDARVMAVVRDISRAKRHEQELESARAEAERSNAWKDRFLANMSHELRTPLNAIIGFSEILGNADLMPTEAEKRKEYADIIHGSGQHLLEVVNSILDISKMEAGRFSITPEAFEVRPLIDACCDMISLKAAQAGVAIDRVYADHLDELVADKRACKQVLINLLGNALKFTPGNGRITVGARQEGNYISMFVSDTGCGMSPYDLPRLGGAFFQAGGASDRTYEGTGLGLSVVRGLIGLHGGEISVESGPGAGTCVTMRMPVDCRGAGQKPASARIIVIPRDAPSSNSFERPPNSFDAARKRA
jgi:cell cycle sensor histidine kinase DivJ